MGIGFGEVLILFFVTGCVFFPIIGSIVGIRRALRRRREGRRSVGAVVWAALAIALALPSVVSPLFFIGFAEVGLSITWLVLAAQANSAATLAAARAAATPTAPPPTT